MSLMKIRSGDAVPLQVSPDLLRLDMEPFHVVASAELSARPLVPVGVCQNPYCSASFNPTRAHQRYCRAACRVADIRELRAVGLKAAPALLAWQMGRYAKPGHLADLSGAGRRYFSALAAEWLRDRKWRVDMAGNK